MKTDPSLSGIHARNCPRIVDLHQRQAAFAGRLAIGVCLSGLMMFQAGCARLTSIYRHQPLENTPQLTSIDAKQRVILSAPYAGTDGEILLRFCAEPPPDVFTALATSLGAEASVGQGVDPAIAAKLASSISENASTIERTQTVNVLRESMYRNCERYLSGAIEPAEFIVQAARDQQLIIQVLAIEQITGVARDHATALTTMANAASSGASEGTVTAFVNARKDYDAKLATSAKAAPRCKPETWTPEASSFPRECTAWW